MAKDSIKDCPLPWQQPGQNLSLGRVANAFAAVLARIGTPAPAPKQARKVPWLVSR